MSYVRQTKELAQVECDFLNAKIAKEGRTDFVRYRPERYSNGAKDPSGWPWGVLRECKSAENANKWVRVAFVWSYDSARAGW